MTAPNEAEAGTADTIPATSVATRSDAAFRMSLSIGTQAARLHRRWVGRTSHRRGARAGVASASFPDRGGTMAPEIRLVLASIGAIVLVSVALWAFQVLPR